MRDHPPQKPHFLGKRAGFATEEGFHYRPFCGVLLNSNPPFFLCINTSFVFTNYQPIEHNASKNRAVRIVHRFCIIQHRFYVSNTIY